MACFGVISLIPYVIHSDSPDAWFLARLYCFPMTMYNSAILLYAYFGGVMRWRKWHWPIIVVGSPVVVSLLAAVVLALVPGDQITRISVWVLYVIGVMMSAVCVAAMWVVLRWARQFDEDDFSNQADFPVVFARRWTVMIIMNMVFCWTGALANSPVLLAVIMLLFPIFMVLFIITALHPHRIRPVEKPESALHAVQRRRSPHSFQTCCTQGTYLRQV